MTDLKKVFGKGWEQQMKEDFFAKQLSTLSVQIVNRGWMRIDSSLLWVDGKMSGKGMYPSAVKGLCSMVKKLSGDTKRLVWLNSKDPKEMAVLPHLYVDPSGVKGVEYFLLADTTVGKITHYVAVTPTNLTRL